MEAYVTVEKTKEMLEFFITNGLLSGFMLATLLHLLGYGIFKGIALLNIRS